MPFQISWESRGVYRTYAGHLTDAERRRSLELITGDRRFVDLKYSITDFLGITRFVEEPQVTQELAALHIVPLWTNTRLIMAAVVVDPVHLEYIRRFKEVGAVEAPYEVFPTLEAARRWIAEQTGIPVARQCPTPPDKA